MFQDVEQPGLVSGIERGGHTAASRRQFDPHRAHRRSVRCKCRSWHRHGRCQGLNQTTTGKSLDLALHPRGQGLGWEPLGKWTKPSAVLISESNYSDAHLFPWTYKHLGLGKLIGMPVAGTGTAVWWETLQDGASYFGIPQVGFRAQNGEFMERALITPDIVVPNDKARLDAGEDAQLAAAVKSLLAK